MQETMSVGLACVLGVVFPVSVGAEQVRHGPVDAEGVIESAAWQPAVEVIEDSRPSPANRRYAAHYQVALAPPSSEVVSLNVARETGESLFLPGNRLRVNQYLKEGDEFRLNVSYVDVTVTDTNGDSHKLGPGGFLLFESIDGRDRGWTLLGDEYAAGRSPADQRRLVGIASTLAACGLIGYLMIRRARFRGTFDRDGS